MSDIRPLPEEDLPDFMTIVANAYPAFPLATPEERQRFLERMKRTYEADSTRHIVGLYRDGRLLGGMMLHDFQMNMLATMIPAGGVGLVAVDLLHKKEKVAKEMIEFFLAHYRQQGAMMTLLYPFRLDFYKQMGFGYGTKMNQYRLRPEALPRHGNRAKARFLAAADAEAMHACYQRYVAKTHGMIGRSQREIDFFFENPAQRIVGYEQDGRLAGYLVFSFEKGTTFLQNDLLVQELVYESGEALAGLLAVLHSQLDQVRRVIVNTQDESFHHLLADPSNGTQNLLPHVYHESNAQGVGLMVRVVDTPGLFRTLRGHNFGGQTCRLRVTVADSFFPANGGSTVIDFAGGRARLAAGEEYEVAIGLDVAEWSSLLVGTVRFSKLYEYGLAEISDAGYLEVVDRLFRVEQKPVCLTRF
ncbi:MAG: GNAT family N-acetyltransferase [Chloroflexi bacterium]|nr:GNAT family N-acetyltransferase [Chloroflexota bacterium]MCI0579410.1 GNAT family N-acetyltransferase [Chloroflexota bacterium]MCI0648943.1 GNAT family N-acetyltransferase [Chloroflexota bacterium]MCI0731778.1 GNAT family N-acetyltransferase [Chloroflexota bacterium]